MGVVRESATLHRPPDSPAWTERVLCLIVAVCGTVPFPFCAPLPATLSTTSSDTASTLVAGLRPHLNVLFLCWFEQPTTLCTCLSRQVCKLCARNLTGPAARRRALVMARNSLQRLALCSECLWGGPRDSALIWLDTAISEQLVS